MKSIDDLFSLIDNKLIELYEAPSKKYYKVFDFKTLLGLLSDELSKNGYNDYYKKKAAHLISVFDDLCNSMVESHHVKDLSYNPNTQEIETEYITHNSITNETETKKIKRAAGELSDYFSKKELPEEYHRQLSETCKLSYHLKKCEQDYSSFLPAVSHRFTGELNDENDIATYIHIMGDIPCKGDKFDKYFTIDSNYLWKNNISFETYIEQIYKERAVLNIMNEPPSSEHHAKSNNYEGIAKALSKYVTGASDQDLQTIIEHGVLPIGAECKKWIGSAADGHRFCYKFNLTMASFNKCFSMQNTKLTAANKKDVKMELNDSISDIISKYPK